MYKKQQRIQCTEFAAVFLIFFIISISYDTAGVPTNFPPNIQLPDITVVRISLHCFSVDQ